MTAAELTKSLETGSSKSESVLEYIERLHGRPLRPSELMKLPRPIRLQIMEEQFALAADIYQKNPDLIMEDTEGPMGHD
jgi:hypothetical protein